MMRIMKRGDPCNRPSSQQRKKNSRMSVELTRIEEQNRSSGSVMQPCTNASKGKNPLSATKSSMRTEGKTLIS